MNRDELVKVWERFTEGSEFILNPDGAFVDKLADGVLTLEEKQGLKMCPCRLGDGSKERNIELLCPCNFEIQKTWKNEGRCWCGLFVKGPS